MKNKEFRSKLFDLTMTIPAQWEILSKETVQKLASEKSGKDNKEQLEFASKVSKRDVDFIYFDFEDITYNCIIIELLSPVKNPFKMPWDELRFVMKRFLQNWGGLNMAIHEMKYVKLNGCRCIFADYSNTADVRANIYAFMVGEKLCTITLNCKKADYDKYSEKFNSVIQTLKIGE